jgi:hypothetical protein
MPEGKVSMRDLKAAKRTLRPIPKLPFLRLASHGRSEAGSKLSKAARIILGAGATSLVVALIIGSFSASGVIDMTLAIALLASAWLVAMGAIVVSEPILGVPPRIKWPAAGVTAVVLAVALTGLGVYENKHFPLAPLKEGAHMMMFSSPLKKGDTKIIVTLINKGDLIARARPNSGSELVLVDHLLSENEEDEYYKVARASLSLAGTGLEIPKDTQRTFDIDLPIGDSQIDEIEAGKKYFYVFLVMAFTDATYNANEYFIASLCNKYYKHLDTPTICLGHTEGRSHG